MAAEVGCFHELGVPVWASINSGQLFDALHQKCAPFEDSNGQHVLCLVRRVSAEVPNNVSPSSPSWFINSDSELLVNGVPCIEMPLNIVQLVERCSRKIVCEENFVQAPLLTVMQHHRQRLSFNVSSAIIVRL